MIQRKKANWLQKIRWFIDLFKSEKKAFELTDFYSPSEDIAQLIRIRKGGAAPRINIDPFR